MLTNNYFKLVTRNLSKRRKALSGLVSILVALCFALTYLVVVNVASPKDSAWAFETGDDIRYLSSTIDPDFMIQQSPANSDGNTYKKDFGDTVVQGVIDENGKLLYQNIIPAISEDKVSADVFNIHIKFDYIWNSDSEKWELLSEFTWNNPFEVVTSTNNPTESLLRTTLFDSIPTELGTLINAQLDSGDFVKSIDELQNMFGVTEDGAFEDIKNSAIDADNEAISAFSMAGGNEHSLKVWTVLGDDVQGSQEQGPAVHQDEALPIQFKLEDNESGNLLDASAADADGWQTFNVVIPKYEGVNLNSAAADQVMTKQLRLPYQTLFRIKNNGATPAVSTSVNSEAGAQSEGNTSQERVDVNPEKPIDQQKEEDVRSATDSDPPSGDAQGLGGVSGTVDLENRGAVGESGDFEGQMSAQDLLNAAMGNGNNQGNNGGTDSTGANSANQPQQNAGYTIFKVSNKVGETSTQEQSDGANTQEDTYHPGITTMSLGPLALEPEDVDEGLNPQDVPVVPQDVPTITEFTAGMGTKFSLEDNENMNFHMKTIWGSSGSSLVSNSKTTGYYNGNINPSTVSGCTEFVVDTGPGTGTGCVGWSNVIVEFSGKIKLEKTDIYACSTESGAAVTASGNGMYCNTVKTASTPYDCDRNTVTVPTSGAGCYLANGSISFLHDITVTSIDGSESSDIWKISIKGISSSGPYNLNRQINAVLISPKDLSASGGGSPLATTVSPNVGPYAGNTVNTNLPTKAAWDSGTKPLGGLFKGGYYMGYTTVSANPIASVRLVNKDNGGLGGASYTPSPTGFADICIAPGSPVCTTNDGSSAWTQESVDTTPRPANKPINVARTGITSDWAVDISDPEHPKASLLFAWEGGELNYTSSALSYYEVSGLPEGATCEGFSRVGDVVRITNLTNKTCKVTDGLDNPILIPNTDYTISVRTVTGILNPPDDTDYNSEPSDPVVIPTSPLQTSAPTFIGSTNSTITAEIIPNQYSGDSESTYFRLRAFEGVDPLTSDPQCLYYPHNEILTTCVYGGLGNSPGSIILTLSGLTTDHSYYLVVQTGNNTSTAVSLTTDSQRYVGTISTDSQVVSVDFRATDNDIQGKNLAIVTFSTKTVNLSKFNFQICYTNPWPIATSWALQNCSGKVMVQEDYGHDVKEYDFEETSTSSGILPKVSNDLVITRIAPSSDYLTYKIYFENTNHSPTGGWSHENATCGTYTCNTVVISQSPDTEQRILNNLNYIANSKTNYYPGGYDANGATGATTISGVPNPFADDATHQNPKFVPHFLTFHGNGQDAGHPPYSTSADQNLDTNVAEKIKIGAGVWWRTNYNEWFTSPKTFLGWDTCPDPDNPGGATCVHYNPEDWLVMPDADVHLYAQWGQPGLLYQKGADRVWDNDMDGAAINWELDETKTAGLPYNVSSQIPVYEGFYFKGWAGSGFSVAGNNRLYAPGEQFIMEANGISFTAVWSNELTVSYDIGGALDSTGSNQPPPAEHLTGTGGIPASYSRDASGTPGNDGYSPAVNVVQASSFNLPANPTWDNHTFIGWSTDPLATSADTAYPNTGSASVNTNVLEDKSVKLYAIWKTYPLIHFDGNGADEGTIPDDTFWVPNTTYTLPTNIPTKNAARFLGWTLDAERTGDTCYKNPTTLGLGVTSTEAPCDTGLSSTFLVAQDDITFVANWLSLAPKAITFDGGSGGAGTSTSAPGLSQFSSSETILFNRDFEATTVGAGETFALPTTIPVWRKHTFVNWTASGGLNTNFDAGAITPAVNNPVTFTANWTDQTQITLKYCIATEPAATTFDCDSFTNSVELYPGDTLTALRTPPAINLFGFDGWYSDTAATTKVTKLDFTTSDTTVNLYGVYRAEKRLYYCVRNQAADGTAWTDSDCVLDPVGHKPSDVVNLNPAIPATHWSYDGWHADIDPVTKHPTVSSLIGHIIGVGTDPQVQFGDADIRVYTEYVEDAKYTVTYKARDYNTNIEQPFTTYGGIDLETTVTQTHYAGDIFAVGMPIKGTNDFQGWHTTLSGTNLLDPNQTVYMPSIYAAQLDSPNPGLVSSGTPAAESMFTMPTNDVTFYGEYLYFYLNYCTKHIYTDGIGTSDPDWVCTQDSNRYHTDSTAVSLTPTKPTPETGFNISNGEK